MRWAEFIMLRTAGNAGRDVYAFLQQILPSMDEPGLIDVALYNHAAISGDFALALLWDTEKPRAWGSDAALGVIAELKRLGLVDHSVWTRIGEQTQKVNGSGAGPKKKEAEAGNHINTSFGGHHGRGKKEYSKT